MDQRLNAPVANSDINAIPVGGHHLHKPEDPIRPAGFSGVGSSDISAPLGGHVIHREDDAIRPVGYSGVGSSNIDAVPSSNISASDRSNVNDFLSERSDLQAFPSDRSNLNTFSSDRSDLNAYPSDRSNLNTFSSNTFSSDRSDLNAYPSGGLISKGDDIVQRTDNIQQDVRQANLSKVEPAVRDTQDAAQNLKWELERERQRQFELQEQERLARQRQLPTEQAIRETEQVIKEADQLKKEAKKEGFTDINPAIKDTRDAAKTLKKELESERKNLGAEPHKEGFIDRAKEWFSGDKDRSSTSANMSEYEAERSLHTKDDLKHHDAVVKDINKHVDRVGDEREGGVLDKAKGWFSRDKEETKKPVVPEYQEARMQHPDLVVKQHDDVVEDINKRDRVGEEGLLAKAKHWFKGSSEPSAEHDNSKPHVYAPPHPVHNFQENPTPTGVLPSATSSRFPVNTQTILLPEQRSSLPTAAMADNAAAMADNNQSMMSEPAMSNLSLSDRDPVTSFPASSSMQPTTTYGGNSNLLQSSSSYMPPSSSSNYDPSFNQQQQQFGGSNLQSSYIPPSSSSTFDNNNQYNSGVDTSSLFNPSTSSLKSEDAAISDPSIKMTSGLTGSHTTLHRPAGYRQADV